MNKQIKRLLSAMLALAMLAPTATVYADTGEDTHDHAHEAEITATASETEAETAAETAAVTETDAAVGDYEIELSYKASYGTASVSSTTADAGDVVYICATANDGYELDDVEVIKWSNGNTISVSADVDDSIFYFTMPADDVVVTVTFTRTTAVGEYDISLNYDEDCGEVELSYTTADKGDTVKVYVDPNSGYAVDSVIVTDSDDDAITVYERSSYYYFTMPASDVTVEVTFVASVEYSLTLVYDNTYGEVELSRETAEEGRLITVYVEPYSGYVYEISVTDSTGSAIEITNRILSCNFHMPASDVTVTVTFTKAPTSGTCGDGLTWELDIDELIISGTGAMTDYDFYTQVPWYGIADLVESVVIESGVTTIGENAFYRLENLQTISMPSTVTSIGCGVFYYCESLEKLDIPASIETIDSDAFRYCTGLTEITVDEDNAVYYSEDGVLFKADGDQTYLVLYPSGKQDRAYRVPSGVTNIEYDAFFRNFFVEYISIPESVEVIGRNFGKCTSLEKAFIYSTDADISSSLFSGVGGVTMYGYTGSTAETYATEEEITFEAITPTFTVMADDTVYNPGDEVVVSVMMDGNPGIVSAKLALEYDNSVFTIADTDGVVDGGILGEAYHNSNTEKCPYILSWQNGAASENFTENGVLATVKFIVSDDVSVGGDYEFTVIYDNTGFAIMDVDLNAVDFAVSADTVSVIIPRKIIAEGDCGDDVQWILYEDGELNISGEDEMWDFDDKDPGWAAYCEDITSVVIEDEVTTVGHYAFVGCESAKSIELPETIESIGYEAFVDCTSLTTIDIPYSVKKIGYRAFAGCISLKCIEVDVDNDYYSCDDEGVLFNNGMSRLIAYPAGSTLNEYDIPAGVTTIDDDAFLYCWNLEYINIPASVTDIGESFYWIENLKKYSVDAGNEYFTTDERGALYDIDMTKLIAYPIGDGETSYTVPDGVTAIGGYVFGCDPTLSEITIPESVETVGDLAFISCERLTSATIYSTDADFGKSVFDDAAVDFTIYGYSNSTAEDYADENDIPFVALDNQPSIVLSADTAKVVPGGEVVITLNMNNNPGIVNAKLYLDYDDSVFAIEKVEDTGLFSGALHSDVYTKCPYPVFWDNSLLTENITANGAMVNITFSLAEDAVVGEEYRFSLSYTSGNIFDAGLNSVDFELEPVNVTVGAQRGIVASGECGDALTWILYDDGELVISGEGDMWDWASNASVPWYRYASKITDVTVEDGVTSVGMSAFRYISTLKAVTLGDDVESIGDYAFDYCENLYEINFPESLTSIGIYAFGYCRNLPIAELPDSIDTIADYAFYKCTRLTTLTLPSDITRIGHGTFGNCYSLASVLIPDEVTFIGEGAFSGCYSLTSIDIPESVKTISAGAFMECENLARILIPEEVTKIGNNAFDLCHENFTIYGYTDSTAHTYARKYEHRFIALDDCNAVGHNYTHDETVEPTCTEDGYMLYTCSRCGAEKSQVLLALGHDYGGDNVCDRCGHTVIDHEHKFKVTVYDPTCTEVGYTEYVCPCGHSYRDNYIEQMGHAFGEGTVITEKTCTTDGEMEYTCSRCGATATQTIPASHEWVENVVTEPTCTEDGEMTRECSECGESETVILPAGHKWEDEEIIDEPDCTTDGSKLCSCSECGEEQEFVIPKLGHYFVDGVCQRCGIPFIETVTPVTDHPVYGMYFEIDDILSEYGPSLVDEYGVLLDYNPDAKLDKVAVYLTQDGTMWRRAIACTGDDITYATYVPYLSYKSNILYTGLNHDWINIFRLTENSDGIWNYSNYATIGVNLQDADGNLLLSLYDIGQAGKETRIFDNLPEMIAWLSEGICQHIWDSGVVTVEPTCENAGFKVFTCMSCGETKQIGIAPTAHSYGEWVVEYEADCVDTGLRYRECSVCGYTQEAVIPATGHSYISEVTKEATCTEDGIITYTCQNCYDSYDVSVNGGHDYEMTVTEATCTEDGAVTYTCSVCGDTNVTVIPASHDYVMTVTKKPTSDEDGIITYECSKCGDTYTETIPAYGEGRRVLLLQDRIPWDVNNNIELLNRLKDNGYIATWDITTTSNFAVSDFYSYDAILIANDQTDSTYTAMGALNDAITSYVEAGGVVIYGACDRGWASGDITYQLPGGVSKIDYYVHNNYILDTDHPIVTGALTDDIPLTNAALYGNLCSHTSFYESTLPEGYNVILQDDRARPTLVEYPLGEGHVLATGLTWEFYYTRVYSNNYQNFSKSVFDDMVVYALSLSGEIEVCDHAYRRVETVRPTCVTVGYTLYICEQCGHTYKGDHQDTTRHNFGDWTDTDNPVIKERKCKACGFTETKALPTLGDYNGDGRVNNVDLAVLQRHLGKWSGYADIDVSRFDINQDGTVNMLDAVMLMRHIAGWVGYENLPGADLAPRAAESFAVVKEFVDFDLGAIYFDLYYDGELVSDALVTELAGNDLDEITVYKFSMLLAEEELFYPGTVYTCDKESEGEYHLDAVVNSENFFEHGLVNAKLASDAYASASGANADEAEAYGYGAAGDETFVITFDDGQSDGENVMNALRTDDETLFYVISGEEGSKTVSTYVGQPKDGAYITFGKDTEIFADKLGLGAADIVFVMDAAAQTVAVPKYTWVFMNFGNPVELLDAEEIGLDTNVYEGTYYKYSGNFVNMDDGSKMSAVYSADMLNRSSAYNFILVDENNVAVDYLNDFYPWTSAVAPTVYIQGERDYAHYGIGDVNSNNASDVTKADWGEADGNTNYFDWLYCHKMGIDYEGFEKVPTSIIKVALVNGIVDVDVEDDLYIIENLTDGTFVCNESDNIHTIRVFELGTEKTGDAALEYLKAAPQIVYMPIADYYDDGVLVFIVATMTADK